MIESLLTARQIGDLLGFSASTVVDWAERGELPAFKIGGRLRFRESETLDWLERRRLNGPGTGGEVSPTPTVAPTQKRNLVGVTDPLDEEESDAS